MAKRVKLQKSHLGLRIIIVLIVGIVLGVSILFENKINAALGLTSIKETEYSGDKAADVLAGAAQGDMNVHFVDVGQGDACIIEFPDNKKMIIDGGDKDEEIENNLLNYIEQNIKDENGETIEYFDYVMLTHTDADHCGSLDAVLKEYPAKVFYRPNVLCSYSGYTDPGRRDLTSNCEDKDTRVYKDVLEAAYGSDVLEEVFVNDDSLPAIEPDGLDEGDPGYYSLSFYGPNSDVYDDWNNYSPIMILEYAGEKISLTGDCEKEGEAEFVEKVKADEGKFAEFDDFYAVSVIKAGHHGSRTSTGVEFVEAITTPESIENTLVIISCGFDNKYEHPHDEKLKQFKEQGFKDENILRTDKNGNIVLSVRFDEASGEMRLFYGASPMVKTPQKIIDWRYIAICIFVVVFVLVLFGPAAVKKLKNSESKGKRKSGR